MENHPVLCTQNSSHSGFVAAAVAAAASIAMWWASACTHTLAQPRCERKERINFHFCHVCCLHAQFNDWSRIRSVQNCIHCHLYASLVYASIHSTFALVCALLSYLCIYWTEHVYDVLLHILFFVAACHPQPLYIRAPRLCNLCNTMCVRANVRMHRHIRLNWVNLQLMEKNRYICTAMRAAAAAGAALSIQQL